MGIAKGMRSKERRTSSLTVGGKGCVLKERRIGAAKRGCPAQPAQHGLAAAAPSVAAPLLLLLNTPWIKNGYTGSAEIDNVSRNHGHAVH